MRPLRGPWRDEKWKGWWDGNPPYHVPVFVLTHHPRKSITMDGGTVFHFVTDGIHAALERAGQAAGGKDVRVGGGPLFAGMSLAGYECVEHAATENAMHVVLQRI